MARTLQELSLAELMVKSEKADSTLKAQIKEEVDKRKYSYAEQLAAEKEFEEVRNRANEPLGLGAKIRCILIPAFDAFEKVEEDVLIDWEYAGYDKKVSDYRQFAVIGRLFWALLMGLACIYVFSQMKD